jgi:TPR repeat protein
MPTRGRVRRYSWTVFRPNSSTRRRTMFLSKESRQSARIMGNVLKFPLYDGDCSPAARELLAVGDVDGALAEWRRLADLGSGKARCVLAYIALKGTHSAEPDLEEARRLASSAISGERGYANYVLACIALKEKQTSTVAQYLGESYKAGFLPGATLLAALSLGEPNLKAKTRSNAESILIKAAAAGHRPALIFLCSFYLRGRFGLAKRALGLLLLPVAVIKFSVSAKYRGMSVNCFQYYNHSAAPIFAEESRLAIAKESAGPPKYLGVLRGTHILAATIAAVVLVAQSGDHSFAAMAGWIAIAAWPYVLSYFVAAASVGRHLVSAVVQTYLLSLITALACDAYTGHLFDMRLSTWMIAGLSVALAFVLMLACGFGVMALKQTARTAEPVPHRGLVFSAHIILGFIAAAAVFFRPASWSLLYLHAHGLELAIQSLAAFFPYAAVALFALPLVTTDRWKPKAYLGLLGVGTALAVLGNSGLLAMSQMAVIMCQFIGFGLAAEWALDGTEW